MITFKVTIGLTLMHREVETNVYPNVGEQVKFEGCIEEFTVHSITTTYPLGVVTVRLEDVDVLGPEFYDADTNYKRREELVKKFKQQGWEYGV